MSEDRIIPTDTLRKRFQPGSKLGRPKGAANRHSQLVARLATENVAEVVTAIIEKAKQGDTRAAELVLRYAAPLPRGRLVQFKMPELNTVHDVHVALNALWQAIASGNVSPEEGAMLGKLLEQHAAVLEAGQLEERLRRLEDAEAKRAARTKV
jgi:hypothetical protein